MHNVFVVLGSLKNITSTCIGTNGQIFKKDKKGFFSQRTRERITAVLVEINFRFVNIYK